jgi:cell division septum initiation protein DivIVA
MADVVSLQQENKKLKDEIDTLKKQLNDAYESKRQLYVEYVDMKATVINMRNLANGIINASADKVSVR